MIIKHILEVGQFSRFEMESLFREAAMLEQLDAYVGSKMMSGRIMATLFYEPSTRTRLSFESAMIRLGGSILSVENAGATSSAAKGESIEDTIRMVQNYADVIVLRHWEGGVAHRAAAVATVPIINAGDGNREHPTQALLDAFTIHRELGQIDGLTIGLVGDLVHGRAAHSLALCLTRFRPRRVVLIAPGALQMEPAMIDELRAAGLTVDLLERLEDIADELDVVYMTRVQRERFAAPDLYERVRGSYRMDQAMLDRLKPTAIILHPLPRLDEIEPEVDADPRAAYFRQARHGLIIRMAVIRHVLRQNA
ncbi:MAG: aspartate carbamoyltransferase [Chloroflexi bacterium]|nr:aspartate carbamoyltransferase [Chloroflexota bacterium]